MSSFELEQGGVVILPDMLNVSLFALLEWKSVQLDEDIQKAEQ